MADWLKTLLLGGSRVARHADDAAAVRHLDDLMKAERYIDQVKHLDEFYGRTPSRPPPVVYVAPRAPSTAEQFLAAGIPMPSAARRLVDAADEAASAGLGPENATLREWVDSQAPLPSATPRGSQRTALEAIGDSWDTQLRDRARAPIDARRRRADMLGGVADHLAGAGRSAADAASRLAGGAMGVAGEMGPMALAAAGTGTVAAIAATRAARQQREQAIDELDRRRRQESQDAMLDSVPMDLGFMDSAVDSQSRAMLRAAQGAYTPMLSPQRFYDIINTLDDPQDQLQVFSDAFSDADLVDDYKPRPRMPMGTYR